jgi:hypothetical protein
VTMRVLACVLSMLLSASCRAPEPVFRRLQAVVDSSSNVEVPLGAVVDVTRPLDCNDVEAWYDGEAFVLRLRDLDSEARVECYRYLERRSCWRRGREPDAEAILVATKAAVDARRPDLLLPIARDVFRESCGRGHLVSDRECRRLAR